MATKQFGVEAVVKGLGKFISDIGKINAAYESNTKAVQKAQKEVERFGVQSEKMLIRTRTAWDRLNKATYSWRDAQINARRAQEAYAAAVAKGSNRLQDYKDRLDKSSNALQRAIITYEAAYSSFDDLANAQARLSNEQQKAQDTLSQLSATVHGGSSSMSAMGIAAASANLALVGLGIAANAAIGGLKVLVGVIKNIYDKVMNVVHAFGQWINRVSQIAGAILFADVLRQISRGLRELSRDVLEAASEFQRLRIQFEGLISRDLVQQMGMDYKEAFSIAGEYAERLLMWVQRLAVVSPFTVQSIARTMALANAFGLAIPLAQDLTKAVGNFAAGMGLTEDHMERIVYNFGQMASQGKLTGREFRDLAISFVPMETLIKQMADEAGMAAAEFRKLALEGGVPVQAFFDHFIKYAEEAFPGAAERMTKTLSGLINKIKDFAQVVLGMQVLGPTLDKITAGLSGVVDKLLSPDFIRSARIIGETLSASFDIFLAFLRGRLLPAISNLGKAFGLASMSAEQFATRVAAVVIFISHVMDKLSKVINNIAKMITEKLGGAGANSGQWGYDLVANFAKGMAKAVKLIIAVITRIAQIITSWFRPKSPPKIAPEIDKWGEQTIGAYVDGMETGARKTKENNNPFEIIGSKFKEQAQRSTVQVKEAGQVVSGAVASIAEDIGESIEQVARRVIAELSRFSADAMTGLVKGFSSADFSVFESITGLVESFLRALPTGSIGETELIPRILGTRETIANAVSAFRNGLVGIDQAISSVLASAGNLSSTFSNYIQSLFNAEAATNALNKATLQQSAVNDLNLKNLRKVDRLLASLTGDVKRYATEYVAGLRDIARVETELSQAQDDLARITKYYTDVLADLKDQLSEVTDEYKEQERLEEIQAAINTGLLTEKELARLTAEQRAIGIRQQIRETEKQRDVEVGAAEARVDAATEAKDILNAQLEEQREFLLDMVEAQYELAKAQSETANEQLAIAEATIAVQIRQNELIQEQIDLLAKLAEKSGGGGGGGAEEITGEEPFMPAPIEEWDLPEIEDISGTIDDIMKEAQKIAGQWITDLTTMFNEAFADVSWEGMTTALGDLWTEIEAWYKKFKQVLEFLGRLNKSTFGAIGEDLDRISESFNRLGLSTEGAGLGGFINFFTFLAGIALHVPFAWIAVNVSGLAEAMEAFTEAVERWTRGWDEWKKRWDESDTIGEKIVLIFDAIVMGVATVIDTAISTIIGLVVGWVEGIIEEAYRLKDALIGHSIIPDTWNAIKTFIEETINSILEGFIAWGDNIIANAKSKLDEAKQAITDRIDAAKLHVETKLGELRTWWETTWEAVREFVDEKWIAIQTLVETAALAVKGFIEDPIGTLQTWWETTWGDIKSYILGIWNDPDGIVQKIITAVDDLVTPIQGKLTTALDNFKTTVLGPLAGGFTSVGTAISGMLDWVNTFVQRLLQSDVAQAIDRLNPFKKRSPPPLAAGFDEVSRSIARFSNYAVPMLSSSLANVAAPALSPTGSAGTTINRNITINVDANYAATQSPVGIYHDVTAALMSVNNR